MYSLIFNCRIRFDQVKYKFNCRKFIIKYQTKTINLTLDKETLGFYNNKGVFIVEPGDFKVYIAGSSITSLEVDMELR